MNLSDYLSEHKVTQAALGKHLGVTQSAVAQWLRSKVPAERVLAVEAATGGRVTRHELRPDLYPIESNAHSAAAAVPHLEDGYRDRGVPDGPPPCDEAAREPAA